MSVAAQELALAGLTSPASRLVAKSAGPGASSSHPVNAPDVFRRVVHAPDAAGIPYMLTGSFASACHAVPRATQDIDLVIAADRVQLAELARAFSAPSYYCEMPSARVRTRRRRSRGTWRGSGGRVAWGRC